MNLANQKSRFLFAIVAISMFLVVGHASAQELPSFEPPNIPAGTVEDTGMHFSISDSSYLNVTLDSTETIKLRMESIPEMVTIMIEPSASSTATSTQITLFGLATSTTYYKYEDDYHHLTISTTDESGNYFYIQDLSKPHLIFIQPHHSTKFLRDDAMGGDCSLIGNWNATIKTCTLSIDLTETIQIDSDGITLDGNGHTLTGSNTGNGIYLYGRTGVTIENLNVKNFTSGIFLNSSSGNTLTNNTVSNNGYTGILLDSSSGNIVTNNTASNNGNDGIAIDFSSNNILKGNIVSYSVLGIILYSSSGNTLTNNTVSNNRNISIILDSSSGNTLTNNTISSNDVGLILLSSIGNQIYNNNFIDSNSIPAYDDETGNNTFNLASPVGGNYWSNYDTSVEGCSDSNNDKICDSPYVFHGRQDNLPWRTQDGWKTSPACVQNCYSNVLFLPGIMGSRLYEEINQLDCSKLVPAIDPPFLCNPTEKELWVSMNDAFQERLKLDTNGKSVNSVYTKDDTHRNQGEIDESGLVDDVYGSNIYQSFVNDLRDWKGDGKTGIIADYSFIPYDWRLSLEDIVNNGATSTPDKLSYANSQQFSESYILKQLEQLQKSSRTGKVTIVAHSNGGLVAKALIQKLKDTNNPLYDKIDKVILVAVPQVGTPDALAGLLHGVSLGYGAIMTTARSRDLAKNMPTMYNLLPSANYFTYVDDPVITFEDKPSLASWRAKYGDVIHSQWRLDNFLNDKLRESLPTSSVLDEPAQINSLLLAQAEAVHAGMLDNWAPATSTKVIQVAGWGEETLAGINYTTKTDRDCILFIYNCKDTTSLTYKPLITIDGDGTVVVPSALAISTSTMNVKRWWVDLDDYNELLDPRISREHKDILEIPQLRTFISNVLQGIDILPTYISETQPPADNKKRLSFTLHSPLDLTAVDASGNRISSATSTIPGARYRRYGEVQYISLPAETVFTVELNGYASGSFDLDVALKQGNDTLATTTFAAIPTATTTTATISFNDGTIANASPLVVDYDGNGTADITLAAKEGEEVVYVPDITPPEAIITFATSTKSILFVGRDDVTAIPIVTTSATTTTVADEAGNTLTLTHSLKTQRNSTRYILTALTYATSTEFTIATKANARYHYIEQKNKHGRVVFNAHLKIKNQNLVAVYNPQKDSTKIILLSKDVDVSDDELEGMGDERLPKNSKVKEVLSGFVIPYLSTEKGEVIINFK